LPKRLESFHAVLLQAHAGLRAPPRRDRVRADLGLARTRFDLLFEPARPGRAIAPTSEPVCLAAPGNRPRPARLRRRRLRLRRSIHLIARCLPPKTITPARDSEDNTFEGSERLQMRSYKGLSVRLS